MGPNWIELNLELSNTIFNWNQNPIKKYWKLTKSYNCYNHWKYQSKKYWLGLDLVDRPIGLTFIGWAKFKLMGRH